MIQQVIHQHSYRLRPRPLPRPKLRTYGGIRLKRKLKPKPNPKPKPNVEYDVQHVLEENMNIEVNNDPVIAFARTRPNDPGYSVYGYGYPTAIY